MAVSGRPIGHGEQSRHVRVSVHLRQRRPVADAVATETRAVVQNNEKTANPRAVGFKNVLVAAVQPVTQRTKTIRCMP